MPHGKMSTSKLIAVVRAVLHACDQHAIMIQRPARGDGLAYMLSKRLQEVGAKFAAYFFEIYTVFGEFILRFCHGHITVH